MSAEEASAILPKEYDTIFHSLPATWIQADPSALPDIIFPIAHLPPFLYNLIAFHFEGRGSEWFRRKYFHSNGTPIKWFRRTHMSKAAILRTFGKYLGTMSHTWNEAYCQNSFNDQDRLLMMQIEKHNKATGFNLSPEDPYRRGLRVPNFHTERCFGVLYGQESDSSAQIMVDTILSAPSKADLIALGQDLSSLSAEDAALMEDILAQLGGATGAKAQGEPTLEGEPAGTSNAADSEEEADDDHPLLRPTHQPPSSPLRKPTHTYIPSPPDPLPQPLPLPLLTQPSHYLKHPLRPHPYRSLPPLCLRDPYT